MTKISAQVSLYLLGRDDLSQAIHEALLTFQEHDLAVYPGSMSTLISGDSESVFTALQSAFQHAAAHEKVVMVVTYSNACPLPAP